jgi:hypothetical protein
MRWLNKPISPRADMFIGSGILGGAGGLLGGQVGMSFWSALFFGFIVFGGVAWVADCITKACKRHIRDELARWYWDR